MATMAVTKSGSIPGRSHKRWIEIGRSENEALFRLLESLEDDDWSKPTDCSAWDVKDIVAHVIGAAEGFTRFSQLRRQLSGAKTIKKNFDNQLAAMNQVQVEDRRSLSPSELTENLLPALERFLRLRKRVGGPGRVIPMYDSSVLGLTNVHYLFGPIICRDVFMHRVDIARATGKPVEFISEDGDLVTDLVRDWARRTSANATLDLTGAMQETFQIGDGSTRISADTVEFCRVLSGRGNAAALHVEGDEDAAISWLRQGCPF